MKTSIKADLNMPDLAIWVKVIGAIFAVCFAFEHIENLSGNTLDILDISQSVADLVFWILICDNLVKAGRIDGFLIALIIGASVLSVCTSCMSLLPDVDEDEVTLSEIVAFIYVMIYVIQVIMIAVRYKGAMRKYALVDLACSVSLIVADVMGLLDSVSSINGVAQRGVVMFFFIPIYLPYKYLGDALKEGYK
jgi:hypothetical protein